jgi:molybdopterin-guanine dinucleotide biosynthesis protein
MTGTAELPGLKGPFVKHRVGSLKFAHQWQRYTQTTLFERAPEHLRKRGLKAISVKFPHGFSLSVGLLP